MQSLGALKPAFKEIGEMMPGFDKVAIMKYPHLEKIEHIHHAGNSSGIVDGAAGVLIGSKAFGEKIWFETKGQNPRDCKNRHRSHDYVDRPRARN